MYLYKITNLINGKKYIGITNDYKKRWSNHKTNGKTIVSQAIDKYGADNFIFELLLENLSIDEADSLEKQYIEKENCLVPYGYNLSKGGYFGSSVSHYGADNPNSCLTYDEAKYLKDHRDIPMYVLYDSFSDKISYQAFKDIYNGKTYSNIKTETDPYPNNLEFSSQFTSGGKLNYDEVIELRTMYLNGVHWEEAYEKYKTKYSSKDVFLNIYSGRSYKLVMPEVFTKENFLKHNRIKRMGEQNGRAKLTSEDILHIRKLAKSGVPNSDIYKAYPQVSSASIRGIIQGKTWKHLL